MSQRIICVDFDGTIVDHKYPEIGAPVPLALDTLHWLVDRGFRIILWTMRSGPLLDEAVKYLHHNGITLWGVNKNPDQHTWSDSPKAYAPMYIDDAAFGCPLIEVDGFGRECVDWRHARHLIGNRYGVNP